MELVGDVIYYIYIYTHTLLFTNNHIKRPNQQ